MSAGELRERIAFAKRGRTDDGFGNLRDEWEHQTTVWGRIMPLRGGEDVIASRLSGVQPVIIRVRYSTATASIGTDWRATDTRSGIEYDITAIANMDERKGYLDIMATAGRAVG